MSITKGLSVIVVAGVLASISCTGMPDRAAPFVGRWTMDTDDYVASVRERQEQLEAGVMENYTKLFGSKEAARERLEKMQEGQLDRARQKELRLDLAADGTFTGRSSSPRNPQDYQGRWIVWPKGVILYDTEVVPATMNEPSPALGWILAMECDSSATMRLYAGRLGPIFQPGLEFARADQPATGKTDVPVASPGADSGFVGKWRYDTKASDVASIANSQLDLTLNADGRYILQAIRPEPDGEQKQTTQSGAWYGAGDIVICIGELESPPSARWAPPHRTAFVIRRATDGDVDHVAGIMPLLNSQPSVPVHRID